MNTRILLLLTGMLGITLSVSSQWTRLDGPVGGAIVCFERIGSTTFAGTAGGGIFSSTNNGATWSFRSAPFHPDSVRAFAAVGTTLFAGSSRRGVYRSTDLGVTWEQVNTGLTNTSIWTFEQVETLLFVGTENGVFMTSDGGGQWAPRKTGLPTWGGGIVYGARALKRHGPYLFYASNGGGVYRSPDSGSTWIATNSGLPSSKQVFRFAAVDSILFATVPSTPWIFRSNDYGLSWKSMGFGINQYVAAALTVVDTFVFAGGTNIYRCSVRDTIWSSASSDIYNVDVNVLQQDALGIMVGTDGDGVYRSSDRGTSWTSSSQGLTAATIPALIASDGMVVAGGSGTFGYRSNDAGASWHAMPGITSKYMYNFVRSDSGLYAGTDWGVFWSTDNGAAWTSIGPAGWQAYGMAVKDSALFIGTAGVRWTTNRGGTWASATYGGITVSAMHVRDSLIFIGKRYSLGAAYSANNGSTWTDITSGLSGGALNAFASNRTYLFAANSAGVFRTTDNGAHWDSARTGLTSTNVLCLIATDSILVAGTSRGVCVSTDNGGQWTSIGAEIGDFAVTSLAADRTYLYAGTAWWSVWRRPAPAGLTGAGNDGADRLPLNASLHQNYPNPFNPVTHISFELRQRSWVRVSVYDVLGRVVAILADGERSAGLHTVTWYAHAHSSGAYFCRLELPGGGILIRNMILVE